MKSKGNNKKKIKTKRDSQELLSFRLYSDVINKLKYYHEKYNNNKEDKVSFANFMMYLLSMIPFENEKNMKGLYETAELKIKSIDNMEKYERRSGYKDGVVYNFKNNKWMVYFKNRFDSSFSMKTYEEALEFYQKRENLKNKLNIECVEHNNNLQDDDKIDRADSKSGEFEYHDPYKFHNHKITIDDLEDFQNQMKNITQDGDIDKAVITDTDTDNASNNGKTSKDIDEILADIEVGEEITDEIFNNDNIEIAQDRKYISKDGINLKGVKLTQKEMAACGICVGEDKNDSKKIDCTAPKKVDKLKKNIKDMERVRSLDDNDWDGIEKFVGSDLNRMEETIKNYDPTRINRNPMSKDPLYKYIK